MRTARTTAFRAFAAASLLFVTACEQNAVTAPARLHAANRANLDATAGPAVVDPATGHFYLAIASTLNYPAAKAAAAALSYGTCYAHLATITSAEEDAFLASQLPDGSPWWIGAEQAPGSAEPAGGWGWITGEPFTYTNWRAGEPNNSGPGGVSENNMYFSGGTGTFVDFNASRGFDLSGYIVEVEGCDNFDRAPVATANGPYTTMTGQTLTLSVVASDPDGDPLSYAWSFGDGTSATSTVPNVDHVYTSAGSVLASVTVTDGQGGSVTVALSVTVQTPAQATVAVSQTITTLVSSGAISSATAGDLGASLSSATASFASGNATAGVNQMNAFIHKVNAQSGKKISASDAAQLVSAAQQIIAAASP